MPRRSGAVRVLEQEQVVGVVVEPGQVEEVALGRPGRVEGEGVEALVEVGEAGLQAGHRLAPGPGWPRAGGRWACRPAS